MVDDTAGSAAEEMLEVLALIAFSVLFPMVEYDLPRVRHIDTEHEACVEV